MYKRVKLFIGKIYTVINQPEFRILPGQIAFFLVLSLVPILSLVGIISSFLAFDVGSLTDVLGTAVPKEVALYFAQTIDSSKIDMNAIVFFLFTFVLASNGANSIINASNSIYKVNVKRGLKRRIEALVMTLILVLLLVFVLIVPVFGDKIIDFIVNINLINPLSDEILKFYHLMKWPISFLVIFASVKFIYILAPSTKVRGREVNFGSFLTTLLWIGATFAYSYYAANMSNYDAFYGSLSNFIILLLWLYILSYIFVIGLAINAKTYEKELDEHLEKLSSIKKKITDKIQ